MKSQILVKDLRPGHSIIISECGGESARIIEIQESIDLAYLDITIDTGDVKRFHVDTFVTQVDQKQHRVIETWNENYSRQVRRTGFD